MASPLPNIPPNISLFILMTIICIITSNPRPCSTAAADESYETRLRNDSDSIREASKDYGNIVYETPNSVLHPSSVDDIIDLITKLPNGTNIAARGHGHSVRGQAMARGGVVVNMTALSRRGGPPRIDVVAANGSLVGPYAEVGGEQLWIDVLRETIKRGLAPVSWTDYLYLSVGGTLSNAGISGQTFLHGPQIKNVLQLEVITGNGQKITCSPNRKPELFNAVLGGLGQFGIIIKAKIRLDKAPTMVKWARMIYKDFSTFTRDQEYLISSNSTANYVEGFLIVNDTTTSQWNSSFSISQANQSAIVALLRNQSIVYSIELAKYYYDDNQPINAIDEDFQNLLNELHFIPGLNFITNVSLFDFLHRVGNLDTPQMGSTLSHPWLNLFIPKSHIADFNNKVLAPMLPRLKNTPGVFIFYPMNRAKWDDIMSAVTVDDDVFYALGLLHMTQHDQYQSFDYFNNEFLGACAKAGINVKQYLPHYTNQTEWANHFGPKWATIVSRKQLFDPKNKLSPGQRIFNH